jgi:hypothetical protein
MKHPTEKQIGGDHYKKMKIQPMRYAMANELNPLQFSVLKYISRYKYKGGVADLQKASHCIDMLIDHEYGLNAAPEPEPGLSLLDRRERIIADLMELMDHSDAAYEVYEPVFQAIDNVRSITVLGEK